MSDVSSVGDLKKDVEETPAMRRLKWVKKVKKVENTNTDKKVIGDKPTETINTNNKYYDSDDDIKTSNSVVVLKDSDIEKECNDFSNTRGHNKLKNDEVLDRISYLLTQTQNIPLKIKLLNVYIPVCFDTSPGQFTALSLNVWDDITKAILELLVLYEEYKQQNADVKGDAVVN